MMVLVDHLFGYFLSSQVLPVAINVAELEITRDYVLMYRGLTILYSHPVFVT